MTDAVDEYHKAFYYARLWDQVSWMGTKCLKHPLDLWIYQEILTEIRPDVIVETGSAFGGTSLYLAHICDMLEHGEVISIDLEPQPDLPAHPRILFVTGSSVDPHLCATIQSSAAGRTTLVILDSLHTRDHVLAELRSWAGAVSLGSYMIVEDTNINGHPVYTNWEVEQGPGPFEAVQEFLSADDRFEVDRAREKFLITFNPNGYLRRVR